MSKQSQKAKKKFKLVGKPICFSNIYFHRNERQNLNPPAGDGLTEFMHIGGYPGRLPQHGPDIKHVNDRQVNQARRHRLRAVVDFSGHAMQQNIRYLTQRRLQVAGNSDHSRLIALGDTGGLQDVLVGTAVGYGDHDIAPVQQCGRRHLHMLVGISPHRDAEAGKAVLNVGGDDRRAAGAVGFNSLAPIISVIAWSRAWILMTFSVS